METIPAKNMLTRTKNNFWFGTDYNMNIYRGCSHGCIYCDSRSDCYGINAFDQVRAKTKALAILEDNLRRKTLKGVVGTGAMSDPIIPWKRNISSPVRPWSCLNAMVMGWPSPPKAPLLPGIKICLPRFRSDHRCWSKSPLPVLMTRWLNSSNPT